MLADSNLIIYAASGNYSDLLNWFLENEVSVSYLRQQRALSLGDALIAATAIYHGLPLATHNKRDFEWIKSLEVIDPMEG